MVSLAYQLRLFISIPFGIQRSYPDQTEQPDLPTAMNTSAIPASCGAPVPARQSLFARLVAMFTQPSPRDLDLAILRDIGVPEALRARAELRQAWRHWLLPDDPFRDS
jgi:hypothetical protein